MTGHRIIKNLTKRGNAVLGVGVYSAAISASNGIDAIKIGTNMDDPWLDFKTLAIDTMPTNPHLPNTKSFYYDSNSEFYVCVMEKLKPILPTDEDLVVVIDICKEYVEGYYTCENFLEFVKPYAQHIPDAYSMLEVLQLLKKHTTHIRYNDEPVQVASNTQDYDDCQYDGRRLDMHVGNFMLRDKILVIIDPWCNVSMDDVADLGAWADEEEIHYNTVHCLR